MKVVIDTNGLLSAIPENGSYKWLYYAFMNQEFTWVVSNEILTEYAEMVTNHFGKSTTQFVLQSLLLSTNHLRYEPSYKWQLVTTDHDDDKFVDCAIGANVDYLVTNDRHIRNLLKIIDLFPPVPIITFEEFKEILGR